MAKPKARLTAKSVNNPVTKNAINTDTKHNIIVYSDDGNYYLITSGDWGQPIPGNDPSLAILDPLTRGGAYLAYVKTGPLGGGIGTVCTLVNLQSILNNNSSPAARKKKTARRPKARPKK